MDTNYQLEEPHIIRDESLFPKYINKFLRKCIKPLIIPTLIVFGITTAVNYFVTRDFLNTHTQEEIEKDLEEPDSKGIGGKVLNFIVDDLGEPGREIAYYFHDEKKP